MRRALTALAVLLAACGQEAAPTCPGVAVARFSFSGSPVQLGDPALAGGLDPAPEIADCADALGFPELVTTFAGTLSRDAASTTGALCRAEGEILFGAQQGGRWVVEDGSRGAVLGACGSTCAAASRTVISGDVLGDLAEPTGFQGTLVEVLTRVDGTCGACALPCAARYALSGDAEGG